MNRLTVFFMFLLLLAISMAFASGIDGRWTGTIPGPEGPLDLVFSFEVTGDTLNGSVETMMGKMPVKPGKVTGNTFAFDVDAGGMFVSHNCTLLGDSILMRYCMMEMDTMEVILKKIETIE